jgi:uncharacterized protein (TIGR02757 family)
MPFTLSQERLREALERLVKNPPARRSDDPVDFPHRFSDPSDIEVVGFISALLAFGRVPLFKRVVERILEIMGEKPALFCAETGPERLRKTFEGVYYRWNGGNDLACLLFFIGEVLRRHGTLGRLFVSGFRKEETDIGPALTRFIGAILAIDPRPIYRRSHYPRGLFSSPARRSACKRLNLYLRWMVRPADGIDFGLWREIPPSKLVIPLDTHLIRIGRYLGLTRRRSPGWAMAKEITESLKRLDPIDPLRYDFALCHLGISGSCPVEKNRSKCLICPLLASCARGRRLVRGNEQRPASSNRSGAAVTAF